MREIRKRLLGRLFGDGRQERRRIQVQDPLGSIRPVGRDPRVPSGVP